MTTDPQARRPSVGSRAVAAPRTPRTNAGRALAHYWPLHPDPEIAREVMLDAIEAIEAEAFAPLGFRDDDGVWHPREAEAPAPSEPLRAALERLLIPGTNPDYATKYAHGWNDAIRTVALQASASEAERDFVEEATTPEEYRAGNEAEAAAPPAPALDVHGPEGNEGYCACGMFFWDRSKLAQHVEYARLSAAAAEGTDAVER